jgi:hypothetical protein
MLADCGWDPNSVWNGLSPSGPQLLGSQRSTGTISSGCVSSGICEPDRRKMLPGPRALHIVEPPHDRLDYCSPSLQGQAACPPVGGQGIPLSMSGSLALNRD